MPTCSKVSVIVPCYKYAKYLPECIGSIREQSYPVHEIIVVSDKSPDNTVEVCKELGVTCIVHEVNKGLGATRNTGIRHATGDLIMCLDADDLLRPDAIKEHVALMSDKTIGQCGLTEFGTDGGAYSTHRPNGATLETLLITNSVYCNAMFNKVDWEKAGGYDESDIMRLGLEDWEFWIRMAGIGCKVNTSDYIALLYRKHGNNMTKETTHPNWNKITAYMREKNKHLYSKFAPTLPKG